MVIPSHATSYNYHLVRVHPTLLEKLDALDTDEQAAMCERLHELAEELQNSIHVRFEAESETGT
ncbi:Rop family plasmid primer RNA-binding protein [Escherichia coli]|nr:Rop family plasmid primer RNA-binding protein [Escherichia coli]EFE1416697.1 Rop family plasmid primer RNA-binding protein [Escherichia coli]EFM2190715.1 Rop family plasmid primer RNA-binding protein [Escherichia coli]EFO1847737.1 Rop family plasmid primer RNA-binding protein [Escherichia coli]EFP2198480.1 Rop family plasmid primer RNA-binding protein [Escherichia coli]